MFLKVGGHRRLLGCATVAASAALAVAGACARAKAGPTFGSLRGTVVDSEGAIVWMAHVVIHADLTGRDGARPDDQTLQTGRDGRFAVQLGPGLYDVCVMADAFTPSCHKLAVDEGKTVEAPFRLVIDLEATRRVADTFPTARKRR